MTTARVRYQLLVDLDVDIDVNDAESVRDMNTKAVNACMQDLLAKIKDAGVTVVQARAIDVAYPSLAAASEPR